MSTQPERTPPCGILVVDKPAGFTSFDVVAKLRGICNTRKIGHGGTLDPMATGVLPIFLGPAAKAVDLQPRQDKVYEAEILFGLSTDTGDITGEVLEQREAVVGTEALAAVLPRFLGQQQQLPPMYSAVKLNGKPLYKYAREGKTVERKPRPVILHSIDLLGAGEGENRFCLRVHCSKGTYIRTLAEEIGAALGLPATLAALRRTAAGVFDAGMAHSLADIQAARDEDRLEDLYLGVDAAFATLPALVVDETAAARLRNGAGVYGMQNRPGLYRAYLGEDFIGLVRLEESGELRCEKLFISR